MSYHSEHQEDQVASIRATETGALQFTPRLYTSDMYGLSMKLTNFESIENYQTFAACFFSQSNLSEYQEGELVFCASLPRLVVEETFHFQTKICNGTLTFILEG